MNGCVYFPALQACCPDCGEVYQKGKKLKKKMYCYALLDIANNASK